MSGENHLVWKEGPRAVWQRAGSLVYFATCNDCHIASPPSDRSEADDWAEYHDCDAVT